MLMGKLTKAKIKYILFNGLQIMVINLIYLPNLLNIYWIFLRFVVLLLQTIFHNGS